MKIKALSHITHDGKEFDEGATLDVTEQQAQALIDSGAAAEAGVAAAIKKATDALSGANKPDA